MTYWVKKKIEPVRGRCDSFVVKTPVHYPTDINLLFDGMRKAITLTSQLSHRLGIKGWRQSTYHVKRVKSKMRIAQLKKRVRGKTDKQKAYAATEVKKSHENYIRLCLSLKEKIAVTLSECKAIDSLSADYLSKIKDIEHYLGDCDRQIDQIIRRVIKEEKIPQNEKVFSVFERHTEWINKGKAGVPVELGLRTCIVESQHQFILFHKVMEKETDDKVAVEIIKETKSRYPDLHSCSFDKGFHSPSNQDELKNYLKEVGLKRKGKLSKHYQALESSDSFKEARKKHSAVESAINGLQRHGLDRCPDRGIVRLERYVSLGVVTRNIHRIGDLCHKKIKRRWTRQARLQKLRPTG